MRRPPTALEVLLDYIDLVNSSIDKSHEKSLELYVMAAAAGGKTKKPTDPARMVFDLAKYYEWLKGFDLLDLFQTMQKRLL